MPRVVVNVLMNGASALPERSVMSLVATTVIVSSGGRVVGEQHHPIVERARQAWRQPRRTGKERHRSWLFTVLGFTASENVSVTVVLGPSPVEPFDGVTV